ncbi:MAG: TrkA family potassium uptake protein [Anaerolineaceae bacterium]|nr:TrkA family potassium uptake protein [Anaerolineaceae bacterium]
MTSTRLVLPSGQRRRTRLARMLRAAWRDSSALLREFRRPLMAFLFVTLVGGFVYGELYNRARVPKGEAPLALIDRPYVMLQLMILETPGEAPPEPELIIFWYALPVAAVYIVGRGVADFVRLFFNREERRSAWEEAVASTYRNHIIVAGVGHVGLRVARTLVHMGFEVVAIDQKARPEIDKELSELGIPMIALDARTPLALEKAGLPHAQAFVVCTSSDHTNLEAIMRARDLNPDIRIVARMWDNQFANQLNRFMGVQAVLSASDLAAPSFAGAAVGIEITQTLHIRGVDYSMINMNVEPGSFMDHSTIDTLQEDNEIDIVLHGRGGSMIVHPDGDIPVQAGDMLVIFARYDKIVQLVARNRRGSNGAD